MAPFPTRRERLFPLLKEESVDAFLITHPVNVSYLTGFSGESSYLVISKTRTILVSDGRFTQQIAEECPGLETYIRKPVELLPVAAAGVLARLPAASVGFESQHVTVAELETLREAAPSITWKPGRDRVERFRMIKDAGEIEQIRQAIDIAERAFAMFRAMLRAEDSEKELADALEMYVRRAGGKCTSFPSIIAVGPRAALPHAPPSSMKVRDADLLLVDWGAAGPFYKSDLTRVLVPHNNLGFQRRTNFMPAEKLREIYGVVRSAQEATIRFLRPGVLASAVDASARDVITQAGYGDYFTHSIGHGIGMQVHEAPLMKAGNDMPLEAGMVVTIEPGIYIPDWGGVRIEDDVLITADGSEVLTGVPKDLESMAVSV